MRIDFRNLTQSGVTALCIQARITPPKGGDPLQLFARALHARAVLEHKLPNAKPSKQTAATKPTDIKKLQAGDHDD